MSIPLSDKLITDIFNFLKDLHDPEGYGFSVTEEVHMESILLQRRLQTEINKEGK